MPHISSESPTAAALNSSPPPGSPSVDCPPVKASDNLYRKRKTIFNGHSTKSSSPLFKIKKLTPGSYPKKINKIKSNRFTPRHHLASAHGTLISPPRTPETPTNLSHKSPKICSDQKLITPTKREKNVAINSVLNPKTPSTLLNSTAPPPLRRNKRHRSLTGKSITPPRFHYDIPWDTKLILATSILSGAAGICSKFWPQ